MAVNRSAERRWKPSIRISRRGTGGSGKFGFSPPLHLTQGCKVGVVKYLGTTIRPLRTPTHMNHLRKLVMPTRAFCTRAYDAFPPSFMVDAIADLDRNKYRPDYWHRFTQGGLYDESEWNGNSAHASETPILNGAARATTPPSFMVDAIVGLDRNKYRRK